MEEKIIRHRRLYAFYQSKVLNTVMIVLTALLPQLLFPQWTVVSVICIVIALALFVGYSLWLWIKKPRRIIVNNLLSNLDGLFLLYYLVIIAIKPESRWWYISPMFAAIVALIIGMMRYKDEPFDICE